MSGLFYSDPDYDLGEGVLQKSGNSFQFTTQFVVLPKYDAVLAISETHDCGLDVPEVGLRLLATALYDQGVNLFSRYQPVPQELAQQLDGTYLVPSAILHTHFYGSFLDISMDSVRGGSHGYLKALLNTMAKSSWAKTIPGISLWKKTGIPS